MKLDNYGARYYNPRISLWYGVDPMAERYPAHSPYCYTMNNPVMLIDPDGMRNFPVSVVGKIKTELRGNSLKRSISVMIPFQSISFGKDCITVHNAIIQEVLFPNEKVKTGSQIVGKNSTHEKLQEQGVATGLKTFNFLTKGGGNSPYNDMADHMSESLGQYLEDNYSGEGVKVYGLSVNDGYHAMTLTYGENEDGEMEYNLFDQGPGTSLWSGRKTFTSPEDLDTHLNEYVQDKQDKRTKGGGKYGANIQIYLIKNEQIKTEDE